jgi:hypothetical protein
MTDYIDPTDHHHVDPGAHDPADGLEYVQVDHDPTVFGASEDDALGAHGNPEAAVNYWFSQHGETCLPSAVAEVVAEVTGGHQEPTEQQAVDMMQQLGLPIDAHGTPSFDEARVLLEQGYHVACHIEQNVALSTLEQYLDQGRSVIVAVNADPMWHGHDDPQHPLGHAVLVTAIDENATASDGTRGVVVLSDTGNPDGKLEQIPLHVFQEAWSQYHNELLVTDTPPEAAPGPALLPMTVNPDALNPAEPAGSPTESYTVQAGDTLWDIAQRVYGDGNQYRKIAQASGISNPDLITPGQTLTIPV